VKRATRQNGTRERGHVCLDDSDRGARAPAQASKIIS
jgi:hypothetical protein